MNDDKLDLYESLIRASLVLIFILALSVGAFGLIAISHLLTQQAISTPLFADTDSVAAKRSR